MSRYSDLVLSLAPVAYWRMGEASGTVAADLTGNYPGTYTGSPTLGVTGALTGDTNTAVTLNGTTQSVSTAAPCAVGALSMWFKRSRTLANETLASSFSASGPLLNFIAADNFPRLQSFGVGSYLRGTGAIADTNWHHVVATWNGVAADGRIYVDGVNVTFQGGANVPTLAGTYTIGSDGTNRLAGSVDEVAIFNRALTAAEVAQLYATGTAAISGSTAIAQALALRFAPGTITAPSGYRAMRTSTYALPNQLPPTPCVLVFPDSGDFSTGNGTRTGTQQWTVRFYYDQTQDLARESVALLGWLDVLTTQLRATSQLGGLVARATVDAWSIGVLTYADQPYAGIELKVTTVTSESWSAAA